MTQVIVDVEFQHLYDLCYRVRHAKLANTVYRIDFYEWVKAGVAYNIRGTKDPKRKISYFAHLYELISAMRCEITDEELRTAVCLYYEDFFQLYQEHLTAQLKIAQKRVNRTSLEPSDLVLLPTFDSVPVVRSRLETVSLEFQQYECKHLVELQQKMATIYASEASSVFKCMAVYYDYGVRREGGGVILEVR